MLSQLLQSCSAHFFSGQDHFFVGKFTRVVAEMTFKVVMNALVAQIAFVVTEITFYGQDHIFGD